MKRLVFTLMLLFGAYAMAQEYQVFSINGTAERLDGKQWKPLVKAQPLTNSDQVRTSKNGSLTILDNSHRKIYAVQSANGGKVETLVATQRSHAKSMTKEAFAEVTKDMFGKQPEGQTTRGGVTYRGDNTEDMLAAWLNDNISQEFKIQNSTHTVELSTINPATQKEVSSVRVGESVDVMVKNESDEALFVGIIDIDAEGEWTAVSPDCELVPPHSSVKLSYAVEFFEPLGTDHLLLLAYNELFNLYRVVELYKHATMQPSSAIPVGTDMIAVEIR